MLRKCRKRSGWQLEQLKSQQKKLPKKWLKKQPVCTLSSHAALLYYAMLYCTLLYSALPFIVLSHYDLSCPALSLSDLFLLISVVLCTSCRNLPRHNLLKPALHSTPLPCPYLPFYVVYHYIQTERRKASSKPSR